MTRDEAIKSAAKADYEYPTRVKKAPWAETATSLRDAYLIRARLIVDAYEAAVAT